MKLILKWLHCDVLLYLSIKPGYSIIQFCKIFFSWFNFLKTAGLQSAFTKFGSFKIEWPGKDGKLNISYFKIIISQMKLVFYAFLEGDTKLNPSVLGPVDLKFACIKSKRADLT